MLVPGVGIFANINSNATGTGDVALTAHRVMPADHSEEAILESATC